MKKIVTLAQGSVLLAGTICASYFAHRLISKMTRKGISKAFQGIFD